MIISISGSAGSGKSTVANILAEKLNMKSYYIGEIRREMARKKNMTLEEYNTYGETHPETDTEVDEYQTALGKTEDNFIIQGRTSWHFIPHSIKIFLTVDLDEGAKRIWSDLQQNAEKRNEAHVNNIEDVKQSLINRQKSDSERYKKYYDIDAYNTANYDIVIDTTHITPQQVVEKILKHPTLSYRTK